MKGKYSISKLERILILSFTFVALALFAAGIFGEAVQSYNYMVVEHQKELARKAGVKNIISFSGGGPLFTIPLFHLILSFIFLALMKARKFIISGFLTAVYLGFLLLSFRSRLDGEGLFGSIEGFTDPWLELWMKTNHIDYLAAVVIVILLLWHGSIYWRFYRNGREVLD